MIRALLYRLLIISAHLQRHGIRLLIAIGRFNARAARSLPQPFSPATFLIANHPRSLPLLFLPLLFPLSLPPSPQSPFLRSRWTTHRCPSLGNPLQLSRAKGPQRRKRPLQKFRDDSRGREVGGMERTKSPGSPPPGRGRKSAVDRRIPGTRAR